MEISTISTPPPATRATARKPAAPAQAAPAPQPAPAPGAAKGRAPAPGAAKGPAPAADVPAPAAIGKRFSVSLNIDSESKRVVAIITNPETGEVIDQFPAEKLLNIAASIREMLGPIVDKQV